VIVSLQNRVDPQAVPIAARSSERILVRRFGNDSLGNQDVIDSHAAATPIFNSERGIPTWLRAACLWMLATSRAAVAAWYQKLDI